MICLSARERLLDLDSKAGICILEIKEFMSTTSFRIVGEMFLWEGRELLEIEKGSLSLRFLNLKNEDQRILLRKLSTKSFKEEIFGSEIGLGMNLRPL